MPTEVAIQFMVPVTVFVDTATKQVERVLQENENMFLPDMADVYDVHNGWTPIDDEVVKEEVIDIAQSNDWPAWDRA